MTREKEIVIFEEKIATFANLRMSCGDMIVNRKIRIMSRKRIMVFCEEKGAIAADGHPVKGEAWARARPLASLRPEQAGFPLFVIQPGRSAFLARQNGCFRHNHP